MILMNEEASKRFPELAKSNYNISLLDQSGKKVLRIKKILDAGIATDNIMANTVRLFVETTGSSTITVEKLKVYKFNNNNGFEKSNNLINETQFPIRVTINGNGYIDIPVGVTDEEFDIIMAITGTVSKAYAAVNGYINNLNNKVLELLKPETNLTVNKNKIVILKGDSASFTVQAEGNNYTVKTDNTVISSVSKNNNTVNVTSLGKSGDCNIIVESQTEGKQKTTKIVKLLIIEKPSIYIDKNNLKLLVNESESITITPSSQADFKASVNKNNILSFDKNSRTITSKLLAENGIITLTPVREEIEGNPIEVKVKVLKPFIKLEKEKLILKEETSEIINFTLSKDTDYSVNISNPNALEYDKSTKIITAKDILINNATITFTPNKDGVNGDPVVLSVNVVANSSIKDTTLIIKPSTISLDAGETSRPISIQTNATDYTFNINNLIARYNKETQQITAISSGNTTLSITAEAEGFKPVTRTINIEVAASVVPMTLNPKSLRLAKGQSGTVRFNVDRETNINLLSSNRDIARAQLNSAQSTITITAQNQVGNAHINITAVQDGFLDNEQQVSVEVVEGTQLSVNNQSVTVFEGNSATVTVTTNATSYTAEANNDKVTTSISGNTLTLRTTRGNYGNSTVTIRAQKEGLPESTVTVNVTIERHTYLEITPADENDTINPIFQLGGSK